MFNESEIIPVNHRRLQCGLAFLDGFPQKRFFQLFVNGNIHIKENGQNGFENREPGCIQGFYNGFTFALKHIHQPLSVDLLLQIHKATTSDLKGEFTTKLYGKFRNYPLKKIEFCQEYSTIEGIKEEIKIGKEDNSLGDDLQAAVLVSLPNSKQKCNLLSFHYFNTMQHVGFIYENCNSSPLIFIPPKNTNLFRETAEKIIRDYFIEIDSAKDIDLELLAIARCSKKMLKLHPFGDGNLRVFVNIMLNFLLIQRGFPLCSFYDPNIFYLYSTEELVDVLKIGIRDSLFVINYPSEPLFGYDVLNGKYTTETSTLKQTIVDLCDSNNVIVDKLAPEMGAIKAYFYNPLSPVIEIFYAAATHKDVTFFETLQGNGADLTIKGPMNTTTLFKGKTLLHVACLTNHLNLFDYLLNNFPELINEQDLIKKTALHYAIENNQLTLITKLSEHLHIDLENTNITLLEFAIMDDKPAAVEILLEHGAMITQDCNSILASNLGRHKALIAELLEKYAYRNRSSTRPQ